MIPTADGNVARFKLERVPNRRAAEEAGEPRFDEVVSLVVTSPGLTKTEFSSWIFRRAADGTERRNERIWDEYGHLYAMWCEKGPSHVSGTPIEAWPGLSDAQLDACRRAKIMTVEMLANLPDSALNVLGMNGRAIRDGAARFVASQSPEAAALAEAQKQLQELRAQMAEIMAREEQRPRRGRPPRASADVEADEEVAA